MSHSITLKTRETLTRELNKTACGHPKHLTDERRIIVNYIIRPSLHLF